MNDSKNCIIILILLALIKSDAAQNCDFIGVNCISCTEYQICDGKKVERVINCSDGNHCDDPELEHCQLLLNCYSYALDECMEAGIFPDSTSESKFYVCIGDPQKGLIKLDFSCMIEEFFDKETLQCVPKELTVPDTSSSVVAESSSTDSVTTELFSSTSTISLTTTVTPSEHTTTQSSPTPAGSFEPPFTSSGLPSDTTPDLISISTPSSEPPYSTSTLPSETSPDIITVSTPSTPTHSTTSAPTNSCTAPGIFSDPSNCKGYFRCSSSLVRFNYTCPGISYFNEDISKCSLTITPACKEQILKNSTTRFLSSTPVTGTPLTETTTIKPAVVKSTTSKPTEATPATTTTTATDATITPATPKPFSCPMPGVFANPANCKTYFRCSPTGQIFLYSCPRKSYFNGITKTCSLTLTSDCQKTL